MKNCTKPTTNCVVCYLILSNQFGQNTKQNCSMNKISDTYQMREQKHIDVEKLNKLTRIWYLVSVI